MHHPHQTAPSTGKDDASNPECECIPNPTTQDPRCPGDGTPFRQYVALGSGLTSFVDQARKRTKNIMLLNTPNRGIGNGDLPLHYRRHHLPAPQTHPANAASIGARGAVVSAAQQQWFLSPSYPDANSTISGWPRIQGSHRSEVTTLAKSVGCRCRHRLDSHL